LIILQRRSAFCRWRHSSSFILTN